MGNMNHITRVSILDSTFIGNSSKLLSHKRKTGIYKTVTCYYFYFKAPKSICNKLVLPLSTFSFDSAKEIFKQCRLNCKNIHLGRQKFYIDQCFPEYRKFWQKVVSDIESQTVTRLLKQAHQSTGDIHV